MATTDFSPAHEAGDAVSMFSSSQILGGRLYKISGNKTSQGDYTVALCGAGERAFASAYHDGAPTTVDANAQVRRVPGSRAGDIARIAVGASALTAGDPLKSDAAGKVVPQGGTGVIVGYACTAAAANATYVEVDRI